MNHADFVGQTLDEKYQIERELGRGGMGTVYLATHLGTERPVAVKIIAPQFMQRPEFVERFRREARAAGRLRHPNVVDVTDFGFSHTPGGQVAYLVMEYLDGCTLGEILEEEKNLPVGWTLDILEQVCSAVQEAHEQGIIHRDLKPDNIWLEPNQRGGYTVKVLDFGIAKLEEAVAAGSDDPAATFASLQAPFPASRSTFADLSHSETIADGASGTRVSESSTIAGSGDQGTLVSEARTVIQPDPNGAEARTAIITPIPVSSGGEDTIGTRLISGQIDTARSHDDPQTTDKSYLRGKTTGDLTRVGAVLGTPLYMSPEQCRGEKLDARSDIYSLGVIAYQMLSGRTPFSGDFTEVMEAHKELPPPKLDAKKVRRKVKRGIHSALEKSAESRPQSAEAFSSELRARSEGIWGLLRRALMIYSEHLPKFIAISTFFSIPMIVLTAVLIATSFLRVSGTISETSATVTTGIAAFGLSVASAFCGYLTIGTITWIVTQSLAVPLRPLKLRLALTETRKKWKTFAGTGVISILLTFAIGIITCGIGFLVTNVLWALVAPVVMMENLRGIKALRRSKELVKRSVMTSAASVFIMFLIPAIAAGSISFIVNITARALDPERAKVAEIVRDETNPRADRTENADAAASEKKRDFNFNIGGGRGIRINGDGEKDMRTRLMDTALETLIQIFWLPMQIFVLSFSSIIVALLYLKTRQAGGESMQELLANFENTEQPRKKWQERVRQRLIQSGRITSKP